jgi:hypothetical protein
MKRARNELQPGDRVFGGIDLPEPDAKWKIPIQRPLFLGRFFISYSGHQRFNLPAINQNS